MVLYIKVDQHRSPGGIQGTHAMFISSMSTTSAEPLCMIAILLLVGGNGETICPMVKKTYINIEINQH